MGQEPVLAVEVAVGAMLALEALILQTVPQSHAASSVGMTA